MTYGRRHFILAAAVGVAVALALLVVIGRNRAPQHLNQGHLHVAAGDYDRAIEAYSAAMRFRPRYVLAYNGRGVARMSTGDPEGAIVDYSKAIDIDPDYALAYYNRGCAYYSKGEREQARRDYGSALTLDPEGDIGKLAKDQLQLIQERDNPCP